MLTRQIFDADSFCRLTVLTYFIWIWRTVFDDKISIAVDGTSFRIFWYISWSHCLVIRSFSIIWCIFLYFFWHIDDDLSILKVLMIYFSISWLSLFIDSHWDIKNINICEWQSNSEYFIQFICAMSGSKVHYLLSWTLKVTCFQIRLVQSNILIVISIKKFS